MKANQQFSVTLPEEMVEEVERKVASGVYQSVGDVIREGVRALLTRDAAVDDWLRDEVVAGHQEYLADPSQGVPAEKILERIKTRRNTADHGERP